MMTACQLSELAVIVLDGSNEHAAVTAVME